MSSDNDNPLPEDNNAEIPSTSTAMRSISPILSSSSINHSRSSLTDMGDDGTSLADEEYCTATELLKELTLTYLNEMAAPKILHEKMDLVDKLLLQMSEFGQMLERNPNKRSVTYTAHKMELCRIEFIINSYLRTRLQKIEKNPVKSMQEHSDKLRRAISAYKAGKPMEQHAELLDSREMQFAQELHKANSTHFDSSFLNMLPFNMRWIPIVSGKSADQTRVFIEVMKERLEDVPVPNMADPKTEILLNLEKGSRHFVPFNCIRDLLENNDVCLL